MSSFLNSNRIPETCAKPFCVFHVKFAAARWQDTLAGRRWDGGPFHFCASIGWRSDGAHQKVRDRLLEMADRYHGTLLNEIMSNVDNGSLLNHFAREINCDDMEQLWLAAGSNDGASMEADGRTRIWRKFQFEAAHRLPHVAPAHPCGRMHGHSFTLVLSVDAGTAAQLDIAESVLREWLDGRCLNAIDGLHNSTSENLARWIWRRWQPAWGCLRRVDVAETLNSRCQYDGQTYMIRYRKNWDAALGGYGTIPLHGHGYLCDVFLRPAYDEAMGWTMDYGEVRRAMEPWIKRIDHHRIEEVIRHEQTDDLHIADWMIKALLPELPDLCQLVVRRQDGDGAGIQLVTE